MLEGVYERLPDLTGYLERIGIQGIPDPTRDTLDRLIYAHLTHVPYENLESCLEKRAPDLTIRGLYEKIVVQRRGGYCYELNGLFRELLAGLGFDCFTVGVCILRRDPQMEHRIVHRGVIVELDGSRFYTDVGFGGPCPVTPILKIPDGRSRAAAVTGMQKETVIHLSI